MRQSSIINPEIDRQRVSDLYEFEREAYSSGFDLIAGVDEAGRGCLAGSLAVGACILPREIYIPRLDDSKKLSPKLREKIYDEIRAVAIAWSVVFIDEKRIDEINILEATREGMKLAISKLNPQPQMILTDFVKLENSRVPTKSIVHGDARSASIAAASILAKVERDRLMQSLDSKFPEYHFAKNKGYGTKDHIEAIEKFGACEIHRKTFAPIKFLPN
ncbi:MAG: ribonuclease HII [Selenomonadaceae bacterium]|nr:ribonuclease HII [Selenomonadaceae bacterium]